MRLAALMRLPVIYVFTHDLIGARRGRADAPADRAAGDAAGNPDMLVLRPADANETAEAWRVALSKSTRRPAWRCRVRSCRRSTAGVRAAADWREAAMCWPTRRAGRRRSS